MKQIAAFTLFLLVCFTLSAQEYGEFTDHRDGQVYKNVRIGNQVWMAENLNYNSESANAIYLNSAGLSGVFGRIYCWEIACEVCPDGWHLPSNEEWITLAENLGGENVAGDKMKEINTFWISLSEEASNISGFSALPGGYLEYPDETSYHFMGEMGFFWSATEKSRSTAWFRYVKFDGTQLKISNDGKGFGMSVRCVKD